MFEATKDKISLHGLGFLQIILPASQRIHIWHPDLPRRTCFADSSIHDHRFGFTSQVLAGIQINHVYRSFVDEGLGREKRYWRYKHDGPRSKYGNRPWLRYGREIRFVHTHFERVGPTEQYHMTPFVFHSTEPGGDGRVATLMRKTYEHPSEGASSTCRVGVEPDVNFDRKQMSEGDMWAIAKEVLCL